MKRETSKTGSYDHGWKESETKGKEIQLPFLLPYLRKNFIRLDLETVILIVNDGRKHKDCKIQPDPKFTNRKDRFMGSNLNRRIYSFLEKNGK